MGVQKFNDVRSRLAAAFGGLTVTLASLLAPPAPAQTEALTPSGEPAPLRRVLLVEASGSGAAPERTFFGLIAARETSTLSFEVGGRLVSLDAGEGRRRDAGEIVARLDPDPFERAVERAELALARAERNYQRAVRLAASDAASEVRAEDALTARNLADVELRDAREALSDTVLRMPFDGIVAARQAAQFTNVAAGEPILLLHDMSEVHVEIDVPERVLTRAGNVGAIAFSVQSDGERVPLEFVEFRPQTGRVGQSFRVTLAMPEGFSDGLIPGATTNVQAALPGADRGDVLPGSAILGRTDRGFEVMVFRPENGGTGRVTRREVAVASPGGTTLRVVGLAEGERVVAAGGHLLEDGERVVAFDGLVTEEP